MLIQKAISIVEKNTMEVNGVKQLFGEHSSKNLLLCLAEEINSYRVETT